MVITAHETLEENHSTKMSIKTWKNKRISTCGVLWVTGCLLMPVLPLSLICFAEAIKYQTTFLERIHIYVDFGSHLIFITQIDLLAVTYLLLGLSYLKLSRPWNILVLAIVMLNYAAFGAWVMMCRFEGGLDRLFFIFPWHGWIDY